MRNGHILYKVHDLKKAVEEWRQKGFEVEYGRAKNPNNALIYFSEGAYIELLANTGIPSFVKILGNLFGRSRRLLRFYHWDECEEGWCGLCIEKDPGSLEEEIAFLRKNEIDGVLFNHLKRLDTKNRELKYRCFFPTELSFPFLMSYFETDPKPRNFVHPNGIKKIRKTVFKIHSKYERVLRELVNDETLEIIADDLENGIQSVEFE